MTKIVINACYGCFCLSREAVEFMAARGNSQAIAELVESTRKRPTYYGISMEFKTAYNRTDPDLVAAVESLGPVVASGDLANLRVIEVPDSVQWVIEQADGKEWVSAVHRTWR